MTAPTITKADGHIGIVLSGPLQLVCLLLVSFASSNFNQKLPTKNPISEGNRQPQFLLLTWDAQGLKAVRFGVPWPDGAAALLLPKMLRAAPGGGVCCRKHVDPF